MTSLKMTLSAGGDWQLVLVCCERKLLLVGWLVASADLL